MPTPILQLPLVSPNQNQKETTINSALAILEAASNDARVITVTSNANVVLSQDNFTRWLMQRVQGNTADMTVRVPALKRFFLVAAEGTGAVTFYPTGGVATTNGAKVPAGTISLLMSDGVNIRAISSGVTRLTDLTDVITTPVANGQVLSYIAAENRWRPATIAEVLQVAFTGLTDTPNSYAGQGGKLVRVKTDMSGIEFVAPADTGANSFTDLEDAPSGYVGFAGKLVAVNADSTGLEFVDRPAAAFTELTDAPQTFTGQGGKAVFVNQDEDGLEFRSVAEAIGAGIDVEDDGVEIKTNVTRLNFAGDLVTVTDPNTDGEVTITITAPAEAGPYGEHAYWRVSILTGGTFIQLRELQLRGAAGGPDLVQGNLASASASQATTPAARAFDNNATTYWEGLGPAANSGVCWVRAQLTNPISVTEIAMTVTDNANAPVTFVVEYSDDGVVWTEAWAPAAQPAWANDEQRVFNYVDAPAEPEFFTDLADAPDAYTGQAGKLVAVNTAEDGLEFIAPPTSGGGAVAVESNSAEIVAEASVLNFTGPGVTVADAGDGRVTINIEGGGDAGGESSHLYWRVLCYTTRSSYFSSKEVSFHTIIGGPSVATGGTALSSSNYNDNVAARAFDNNLSTEWGSAAGDLADGGAWIGYQFAAPIAVQQVKIAAAASEPESFTTGDIQFSDDGVTWTTLFSPDPQPVWTANEVRAFSNPVAEATFLTLADTPETYDASAGKLVAVKATGDGLEFVEDQSSSVIGEKTANYVAALGDAYAIIPFNSATNVTLTLPANSAVGFPINTQISVLAAGAGMVEIGASSGVTIRIPEGVIARTRSQWSTVMALKIGTDTWVLMGDLDVVI